MPRGRKSVKEPVKRLSSSSDKNCHLLPEKIAKSSEEPSTSKYFATARTDISDSFLVQTDISKDQTEDESLPEIKEGAALDSSKSEVTGSCVACNVSADNIAPCAKVDNSKSETTHLSDDFYNQPCINLAQALLGKILVHILDSGEELSGMIVETEAYPGNEDVASHSYNGRRTERNEAMFMAPGTAYVYNIYGMYCCMNISSQGDGAAVLLRALAPVSGMEVMQRRRGARRSDGGAKLKESQLCNGPSKLAEALGINKQNGNRLDLRTSHRMWLRAGDEVEHANIVTSKRIGIDSYGLEWANKPWRFYVLGNPAVSKRDKVAETALTKS